MKTSLLCLIFIGATAHAQTKVDFALYAADATIRTLDITSSHALATSPCNCFHESDPLSPSGRSLPELVAFQYGISAAVGVTSRELVVHHHPRLGRLLIVADIIVETWAVQHNMRMHENASPAMPFGPAQTVPPSSPIHLTPIIARPR